MAFWGSMFGSPYLGKLPFSGLCSLSGMMLAQEPKLECRLAIGLTLTPKVCRIMAFWAIFRSFGLLFYLLLGFRYRPRLEAGPHAESRRWPGRSQNDPSNLGTPKNYHSKP